MGYQQKATAVVAGATGLVGRELVKLLLEHQGYSRITALVRRELGITHPKLEERLVSFDRLDKELDRDLLNGADVFCALGTTIKAAGSQEAFRKVDYSYPLALGRAAHRHDAASFIIVTAMGSSERSNLFYTRVKGETERDLAALGLNRLVIFRPSLLLGDRTEVRRGERASIVFFKLFGPLMIGHLARYKAIDSRKVAQAMISAARIDGPSLMKIESEEIYALASSSDVS